MAARRASGSRTRFGFVCRVETMPLTYTRSSAGRRRWRAERFNAQLGVDLAGEVEVPGLDHRADAPYRGDVGGRISVEQGEGRDFAALDAALRVTEPHV